MSIVGIGLIRRRPDLQVVAGVADIVEALFAEFLNQLVALLARSKVYIPVSCQYAVKNFQMFGSCSA